MKFGFRKSQVIGQVSILSLALIESQILAVTLVQALGQVVFFGQVKLMG